MISDDKFFDFEGRNILKNVNFKKFKSKKILILGANSFFASYLALAFVYSNYLNKTKCKITCVSKSNPKSFLKKMSNSNQIKFIKMNISEDNSFQNILKKKFDYIFHAATYGQPAKWVNNEVELINLNIGVLNSILKSIKKKNTKLIFFSSCDVYGKTNNLPVDENFKFNVDINSYRSNYALSKIMGERLCFFYKKQYNIKSIIIRPGHTFGVGQSIKNDNRVILELIKKAIFKKEIKLIDAGKSIKTWGYISDIICMILNVAQYGKQDIYNVTGKNFLSILKIAKIISKFFGGIKVVTNTNNRNDDPEIVKVYSKNYNKEFKKPPYTSFEDGINRLIKWNLKLKNI